MSKRRAPSTGQPVRNSDWPYGSADDTLRGEWPADAVARRRMAKVRCRVRGGHPSLSRVLGVLAAGVSLQAKAQFQVTFTDLNPVGATESRARAVEGTRQVGTAVLGGMNHAALWSGSAESFTDLHPAGPVSSEAFGLSDSQQCGYVMINNTTPHAALWSSTPGSIRGYESSRSEGFGGLRGGRRPTGRPVERGSWPNVYEHATLWSGSADSFVDIHPLGGGRSSAVRAVHGSRQAGYAITAGWHAALWLGDAESIVDLNPVGAVESTITGLSGTQQAGEVAVEGSHHAAVWSGSADSLVDLHPAGAEDSTASATSGLHQVGRVTFAGVRHAALWSGTAASFVDLGNALGSSYTASEALGIWTAGAVSLVVGDAFDVASGQTHAILWTVTGPPRPPRLELSHIETVRGFQVLTLHWVNNGSSCLLEDSESLTAGWNHIPVPWITNANRIFTTVTNASSWRFYRLKAQ